MAKKTEELLESADLIHPEINKEVSDEGVVSQSIEVPNGEDDITLTPVDTAIVSDTVDELPKKVVTKEKVTAKKPAKGKAKAKTVVVEKEVVQNVNQTRYGDFKEKPELENEEAGVSRHHDLGNVIFKGKKAEYPR